MVRNRDLRQSSLSWDLIIPAEQRIGELLISAETF